MENGISKIEGWGLSDETQELLLDFISSADYYRRWLIYMNDLLIVAINENLTQNTHEVECMYALKHIRDLLEALHKDNPALKDD